MGMIRFSFTAELVECVLRSNYETGFVNLKIKSGIDKDARLIAAEVDRNRNLQLTFEDTKLPAGSVTEKIIEWVKNGKPRRAA